MFEAVDLNLRSSMAAMVKFEASLQQLGLVFHVFHRRLGLPALFAAHATRSTSEHARAWLTGAWAEAS